MYLLITLFVCVGLSVGFEDKTVYQYLVDNGYTTLAGALQTAGLESALTGTAPITLLAPTEAAFTKLGTSTLNSLEASQLASILRYHVIPEFVLLPMISKSTNKTTLNGQTLTLKPSGATVIVNNASMVDGLKNDIIVNNGAIQPIDTVLIPPQLPSENIAQILLRQDDKFKDLVLALTLADLVKTLEGSEFTLFAPTNDAFAIFNGNFQRPTNIDPKTFYVELLKYHVVPGGRRSSQLRNGQMLYTLHGTPVNITIASGGVKVNDANVSEADILATNGVVHAIDKLLIPRDLFTRR